MFYQELSQRKNFLTKKIQQLKESLKAYPPGNLICISNGKGKYVRNMHVNNGTSTYIPKKDLSLAKSLARKKYLSAELSDFENELKAVNSYLKCCDSYSSHTETLMNRPAYQKMISQSFTPVSEELSKWASDTYEKNPHHPENLIQTCLSGHIVRSKSEALIDQALYAHQIPFRYECALVLKDVTYYPDFTIRHPRTGEIRYWEHFGLMDSPNYATKAFQKLQNYCLYGYIPGIQLITTYETKDHPLTLRVIEDIISHYFL